MTLPIDRSSWKTNKFGLMIDSITKRIENPSKSGMDRYVGLEHLDPGSLTVKRWGTPDQVEASKLIFKEGDVIFGRRRAYQKKVSIVNFEGICSAHALVLRGKPELIDPRFLPVFLSSDVFLDRAIKISVGSLSPTVNWKTLATQEFSFPPITQQAEIAELLWTLDNHKENLESSVASLKRNVSKIIEIELENISLNLGDTRLASLCTVNPSVTKVDSESPFIEMADVEEWGYWAKSSSSKGSRGGIKAEGGDILLARITPCLENGKLARVPLHLDQIGGSTEFLVIRATQVKHQDYLMMLLSLPRFHSSLVHAMVGSTGRQRLSADTLRNLTIPNSSVEDIERLTKLWTNSRDALGALLEEIQSVRGLISKISKDIFSGEI